jgi:hypothetical protein
MRSQPRPPQELAAQPLAPPGQERLAGVHQPPRRVRHARELGQEGDDEQADHEDGRHDGRTEADERRGAVDRPAALAGGIGKDRGGHNLESQAPPASAREAGGVPGQRPGALGDRRVLGRGAWSG